MVIRSSESDTVEAPELPTGEIEIQAPPDRAEPAGMGSILVTVLPMMGSMGVMVFMAMSQGNNTRMLLMGGVMIVAMLSMVGYNIYRQVSGHREAVSSLRREYLAYLSEMRDTVRNVASRQRAYISWHFPDPDSLVLVAEDGARLWEREITQEDVLSTRLGSSTQDLSMELIEPELPPLASPDVVCHSAMSRFLATHATVDEMPFGVPAGQFSHIEVAGDRETARAQVRAMLIHLAVFVPPTALRIAVLCSERSRAQWEWLKWLPHARSTEVSDALGGARMVTTSAPELADLLGEDITSRPAFQPRDEVTPWPHVVLVVDDAVLPAGTRLGSLEGTEGVTVLRPLTSWGPLVSRSTMRLVLHPGENGGRGVMEVLLMDRRPVLAVPDAVGVAQAEAVARRMVRWSEGECPESETPVGQSDPKRSADLMDLLDIGDVRDFTPYEHWHRKEGRERLRVPFGVTPEGMPVVLDIKESAQAGMGPHGLLIGATGSGKSEVLRTLVLALALTHPPEQLNFVLVDFKGGATFAGMADLPHVSAMISNLEAELSLVDRMEDALRGEMVRRQELLRAAGNYANVTDYEADRAAGKHSFAPVPALLIVLDEFSELLSAKPEFIELFVMIGRLGRSLSVHLLLSSQRLESGRLRGLDSHLSYRIGLRTFSAAESREVLGVTDAYELPSFPGVGYLKPGTDQMIRFRASYVATPPPVRRAVGQAGAGAASAPLRVLPFTAAPVLALDLAEGAGAAEGESSALHLAGDERWAGMSEIDIAVARMKGQGTPAHQVWLPPLDVPETMDSLMPDLTVVPGVGLVSPSWRERGWLRVPLGLVDLPLEQKRELLAVDLSGANGHVAVVGGPLTGKSTALRSLVMALSLTHTPQEAQFYVLDMGGGTFTAFDGAAHVSGVATRDRAEAINRILAEVEGIIEDRERYFRVNRIDSIGTYRLGRAQGRFDDGYGDVFLVVDGWGTLRSEFDGLELRIQTMMARALTYGVHLMVSAQRWMDLRLQVRDMIGTRIELRLGDPTDTQLSRKAAPAVPEGRPGRGIEARGHQMLLALPRADGDHDSLTLSQGVADTLERIAGAVPAGPGPRLRLLPERITVEQALELPGAVAADTGSGPRLLLGVEETRLGALAMEPRRDSHLFLFGDAKSGKTTFLRSVAAEVMRSYRPDQAQFIVVDLRRSLLGEIPDEYLMTYITNRQDASSRLGDLADFLKGRLPGDRVTTEQLRTRSWWKGAEVWVLVDDYDLVATTSGNPVATLQPLLPQALDVGLHVVIARRMGGASRAVYEPVLQSMNELGTTGFLLSGSPDEGAVIGRVKPVRASPGRARVVSRELGLVAAQLLWTPPRA